MVIARRRSMVPGVLLTILGLVFLSSLFYRANVWERNVVGPFLVLILGVSCLMIGLASISRAKQSKWQSAAPTTASKSALPPSQESHAFAQSEQSMAELTGAPES